MKQKRKAVRVHNRKIDRAVAMNRMKKAGCVKIAHKNGSGHVGRGNNKRRFVDSFFSKYWRQYA